MTDPIKAMSRGIAAAFALKDSESDIPDPTVDRPDFSTMFVPMAEHAREQIKAEGFEIVRGWQPIETAPRDGTEFLACLSNRWAVILSEVIGADRYAWYRCAGVSVPVVRTHFGLTDFSGPIATHWMPLPTPPKGEDHG